MDNSQKVQRHAELSWKIVEAKILYYAPRGVSEYLINERMPPDHVYDAMEREYLQLCIDLDTNNTVVHKDYLDLPAKGEGMFEVDYNRPSVQMVYKALFALDDLRNK